MWILRVICNDSNKNIESFIQESKLKIDDITENGFQIIIIKNIKNNLVSDFIR